MVLDAFENTEEPIYPKVGEDLLDFLSKQRDANANVTICPSCKVVFNKKDAQAFKEEKKAEVEKER